MATKKKYVFIITKRKAYDGTTFPDYISRNYKKKRDCLSASYNFNIIDGKSCGGSASITVKRVK